MAVRSWAVHGLRSVVTCSTFEVLQATYQREDGFEKDMVTLACPDWANVVAVTPSNELVLVQQFRPGPRSVTWELPGGIVEPLEEPLAAAHRELFEETGFAAELLEPLGWAYPNPAMQSNRIHFFYAENARSVQAPSFDGAGEECEVLLIPLCELSHLLSQEPFSHALCHAALLRAWPHLRAKFATGR